jgi:hypothetical protein
MFVGGVENIKIFEGTERRVNVNKKCLFRKFIYVNFLFFCF